MSRAPTVGLVGLNGHNLGSILMALAVRRRLPDVTLAVPARTVRPHLAKLLAPSTVWLWSDIGGHPLLHRLNRRIARATGTTALTMPPRRIRAVIDISGYAYGAPFNPHVTAHLPQWMEVWSDKGIPTVLLPQAFGPFPDDASRRNMARALERAALVCARDGASARALEDLGSGAEIRRGPDLAIESAMSHPAGPPPETGGRPYALILPNRQILRKTDCREQVYLDALVSVAERCVGAGQAVVVASHEGPSDLALAQAVCDRVRGSQVIADTSLGAILGAVRGARVVISSRFHGLVAALANGVPAMSVGWAGKYDALLQDFGVERFALDVNRDRDALADASAAAVDELLDRHDELVEVILASRSLRLDELDRLWDVVGSLMATGRPPS